MNGRVFHNGKHWRFAWGKSEVRCAVGKGGVIAAADKREGDGATPVGTWPLRHVLYRADRLDRPISAMPVNGISRDDGWSDDPADPLYNQPVKLPHGFRHETLWRDDAVYDVIVPMGYNDAPPAAGRGSAIFLHVARPDYAPTEGCVALALNDLLAFLSDCGAPAMIIVEAP